MSDESLPPPRGGEPDSPNGPRDGFISARVAAGLRTVSLSTFASRILGLVRDVAMASVFGNGPLMDAFTVAFRVPNLARGMFGEGALTAAFLPAFLRERARNGERAGWRITSAVFVLLGVSLSVVVAAGEVILIPCWFASRAENDWRLLVGLTAVLLPYLVLVCLTAQLNAVLYALNHFLWPSLEPVLANVVWIACLWFVVPQLESPTARIYAVSIAIVASGGFQLFAPVPTLRRLGFHYQSDWRKQPLRLAEIGKGTLAVAVGLSVTQLNSMLDGFIAWGFTRPESGPNVVPWMPFEMTYPLEPGTASALYFGQRMYQFPLGVFGVALGTVIFPLLSRHAAEGRLDLLRRDVTRGVRLVLFISIPASVGLVILAHPLTVFLFQRGKFDSVAVGQTAAIIRMFGSAVWAYCGLLIVNRGFYAVGDRRSPLTMSIAGMVVNLGLDLILMEPMGGSGLALATAVSSMLQFGLATWLLQNRVGRLNGRELARSIGQTCAASSAMALVCAAMTSHFPIGTTSISRTASVAAPIGASLVAYFLVARFFAMSELRELVGPSQNAD